MTIDMREFQEIPVVKLNDSPDSPFPRPDLLAKLRAGEISYQEPAISGDWMQIAHDIVHGPRQASYAHPLPNFLRIAIEWTLRLMARGKLTPGAAIDPDDVVWMMVGMKTAGREVNAHSDDNGIDTIGYTYCWNRMDIAMKWLGFENGMLWFQNRPLHELVWLLEELTG